MIKNKQFKQLFIQEVINCFAYFAPLTLIAIFLNHYHQMDPHTIAFIMLFGSIATRWGRILISPILSKLPVYMAMSLLQLVGAMGYLLLFYGHSNLSAFISVIMIGLFYGNNSIFIRVLIAIFSKNKQDSFNEKFAWLHMATNIASCLGPFIFNTIYVAFSPKIAFIALSLLMLLMSRYSYVNMRHFHIEEHNKCFNSLFRLIIQRDLIPTYVLMIILWFFYAQMFTLAPILLAMKYHMPDFVWVVAALNGFIIVFFSVYFNRKLPKLLPNVYAPIILSFLLSLIGFAFLISNNGIIPMMVGVGFITLAEIFFIPGFNVLLSQHVSDKDKVAIFAINSLFTGVGESAGYYFGTLMGFTKGTVNIESIALIYFITFFGLILSIGLSKSQAQCSE